MAFSGFHQECRPTFPALAEMEIETGDDGARMQPVNQDGLDELFRRALRKLAVERIFDNRAETDGLKDARLQWRRREAKDRRIGPEHGTGMRLEGQHQRGDAAGFRQFQRAIQHGPVAEGMLFQRDDPQFADLHWPCAVDALLAVDKPWNKHGDDERIPESDKVTLLTLAPVKFTGKGAPTAKALAALIERKRKASWKALALEGPTEAPV